VIVSADWAEVYRTTFEDLVRYLYRKVWDAERAQDLAQEAFVRVLDDQPDNARAWLFTVASNLARDEVRTVIRRRRHLTLIKAEKDDIDPAPDPIETMDRKQKQEAAREALGQLSERDREVLLLWDAGFDYNAIAEQTGLAIGAIGTTLSRARKRLVAAYDATHGAEDSHVARG
jgi:RNA polymerase sigma-70 factor, ECF subfamily